MSATFDAALFTEALRTREIGCQLEYRESVDTTMLLARELAAAGAPHGTVVLAEEQTAGRGRRGRSFYSPRGENIYATLILRLNEDGYRRLPLAVPLAVCEAIRSAGADGRIKWPNDIWVERRKVCGMLIDAEAIGRDLVAYPGIGINVNGDPTVVPELRDIAGSLSMALGRQVERESLLAGVCNELERALDDSHAHVLARYRDLSLVIGQMVTIHPPASQPIEGTAIAIGDDGAIVVRMPDGAVDSFLAGDVSLRLSE
jgi:BirA family transcriptional regulator, biotin operon repressor / biotin---[acetyl-CoA-carboxylase] ligase